nr:NADH dehydrogenase subunit 4L [Secretargas transgariepinus]QLD97098.1 NADH dehydrogenase subunit 4L [Secretargas transgariepinus]
MMMSGIIVFLFGLISFLINHKHFLMLLLCFEFMYLGIFMLVILSVGMIEGFLNLILYLVMVVCEASLGLSVLVMSVYFYGNDSLSSFYMLKC